MSDVKAAVPMIVRGEERTVTLENWWGFDSLAHFYPNFNASHGTKAHRDRNVTSCGLRMTASLGSAMRFDPETGRGWPRCEKCKEEMPSSRLDGGA